MPRTEYQGMLDLIMDKVHMYPPGANVSEVNIIIDYKEFGGYKAYLCVSYSDTDKQSTQAKPNDRSESILGALIDLDFRYSMAYLRNGIYANKENKSGT
jgi:hypothetical protein